MVTSLSELDRAVLEHVARYRLTLPAILAQSAILDREAEEPAAALDRMTGTKLLFKGELLPGVSGTDPYYSLAPGGATALGRDPESARPLKRDARIEAFAIAQFCCRGPVKRHLFTRDEFVERFGGIWYPGQPIRYYSEYDAIGVPRLVYVKVDMDGAGRWDRLIESCSRFVRQRTDTRRAAPEHFEKIKTFASLLARDRFRIAVLTALDEKKRAIELKLDTLRKEKQPVPPIDVHVVPGLLELLCPTLKRER